MLNADRHAVHAQRLSLIQGACRGIVRASLWRPLLRDRDREGMRARTPDDPVCTCCGSAPRLTLHRFASASASRIRSESRASNPFASFCMELIVG